MPTRVNTPLILGVSIGLGALAVAAALAPAASVGDFRRDRALIAGLVVCAIAAFPLSRALRLPGLQARLAARMRASLRLSLCSISLVVLAVAALTLVTGGFLTSTLGPILAALTLGAVALLSVVSTAAPGRGAALTLSEQNADAVIMTRVVTGGSADADRARAA